MRGAACPTAGGRAGGAPRAEAAPRGRGGSRDPRALCTAARDPPPARGRRPGPLIQAAAPLPRAPHRSSSAARRAAKRSRAHRRARRCRSSAGQECKGGGWESPRDLATRPWDRWAKGKASVELGLFPLPLGARSSPRGKKRGGRPPSGLAGPSPWPSCQGRLSSAPGGSAFPVRALQPRAVATGAARCRPLPPRASADCPSVNVFRAIQINPGDPAVISALQGAPVLRLYPLF